jgi:hypothetical protein
MNRDERPKESSYDKAARVSVEVDRVTMTMNDNIELAVGNLESGDALSDKVVLMAEDGQVFKAKATKARKLECLKYWKLNAVLIAVGVLVLLYLLYTLLGGSGDDDARQIASEDSG